MNTTISIAPADDLGNGSLRFNIDHNGTRYRGNTHRSTDGQWSVHAIKYFTYFDEDDFEREEFCRADDLIGRIGESTPAVLRAHLVAALAEIDRVAFVGPRQFLFD